MFWYIKNRDTVKAWNGWEKTSQRLHERKNKVMPDCCGYIVEHYQVKVVYQLFIYLVFALRDASIPNACLQSRPESFVIRGITANSYKSCYSVQSSPETSTRVILDIAVYHHIRHILEGVQLLKKQYSKS